MLSPFFLFSSFSFPGVQVKVPSRPGVPADLLFLCAGEFILIGTSFHVVLKENFSCILPQVAILILFFLDAIREMQKYSAEETQQKTVSQCRR